MRGLISVLVVAALSTTVSCGDRAAPVATPSHSSAPADVSVDRVASAVYRDKYGAGAMVRNPGTRGVRDIDLSVSFYSQDTLVETITDTLAFCPGRSSCPWAVSFTITTDAQRTIDRAQATIAGFGEAIDDGVVRPIDPRVEDGAVSFELPLRTGVAIVYAERDGAPYFGVFAAREASDAQALRFTDADLPIGPGTRGVFYDGYLPAAMQPGGH